MMPYERFDAWRLCHELALAVYRVTESFPQQEIYGLTAQARRAAFSAPANIAEGSAKRGRREFRRFLDIAMGSLVELAYLFRYTADLGLLTAEDAKRLQAMRDRAAIVTWKLYRSMGPDGDTEPGRRRRPSP
jgi:four helix bundle protein